MTSRSTRGALRTSLAGLVAVALATAAGLLGLGAAPAAAAYCSGSGVNVVVDFQGLGGGVQKGCDPNGAGKTADKVFPAAGFSLRYAQRQPGFVCRVQNLPGNEPCVNTPPSNAYWGLYSSDGKSGNWNYSNSGVGGLKVQEGGFVAFSWQNGGPQDPPGAAPVSQQPAPAPTKKPSPTQKPTQKPSQKPSQKPTTSAPSPGGTTSAPGTGKTTGGTPSAKGAKAAKATAKAKARAERKSQSATPSTSSSPSSSSVTLAPTGQDPTPSAVAQAQSGELASAEQDNGLPSWVPLLVVLGLGGAAAGAVWWRRRTGPA